MRRWLINGVALVLALFLAINGAVMLAAPGLWYASVPGVVDSGPLNVHFVCDIGMTYLLLGAACGAGVFWRTSALALWLFAATWLGAHAIFHIIEAFDGPATLATLTRDFVGVTLPALMGIALAFSASRRRHPVTMEGVAH